MCENIGNCKCCDKDELPIGLVIQQLDEIKIKLNTILNKLEGNNGNLYE